MSEEAVYIIFYSNLLLLATHGIYTTYFKQSVMESDELMRRYTLLRIKPTST